MSTYANEYLKLITEKIGTVRVFEYATKNLLLSSKFDTIVNIKICV